MKSIVSIRHFVNSLKRLNGDYMKHIGKLLEDLYRLGKMNGFTQHQFDCAEDDYDAERWFEKVSKIAKEYDINIPNYEDWEPWEKAIALNDIVKTIIKNQIYLLIDEKN